MYTNILVGICLLALLSFPPAKKAETWNYEELGTDAWTSIEGFEKCGGNTQSPIDITNIETLS